MTTRILAIDPGASGGVAELYTDGRAIASPLPDDGDLRDHLECAMVDARRSGERLVCYLELVGGFVGGNPAPGSAMFNFGSGYGYIRGLLAANRIETQLVRPQAWQAGIPGVRGVEKADRKRALKEHAARLFPQIKVTLKTADALCIAAYARAKENGQPA
jgi:hypothetical protein